MKQCCRQYQIGDRVDALKSGKNKSDKITQSDVLCIGLCKSQAMDTNIQIRILRRILIEIFFV